MNDEIPFGPGFVAQNFHGIESLQRRITDAVYKPKEEDDGNDGSCLVIALGYHLVLGCWVWILDQVCCV